MLYCKSVRLEGIMTGPTIKTVPSFFNHPQMILENIRSSINTNGDDLESIDIWNNKSQADNQNYYDMIWNKILQSNIHTQRFLRFARIHDLIDRDNTNLNDIDACFRILLIQFYFGTDQGCDWNVCE